MDFSYFKAALPPNQWLTPIISLMIKVDNKAIYICISTGNQEMV